MAILTKNKIIERIKSGDIEINPSLDAFQLQGHAIDLRLGFTFLVPKSWEMTEKGREAFSVDPLKNHGSEYFDVVELEQGQYFEILPQEYVLVSSLETIKVPNDLMAVLYPRSSVNRKGLSVDLTGIIDAGYAGPLTLPVKNNTQSQVIRLHPGERFCQIVFEELSETITPRKSRWHQKDIIERGGKEKSQEMKLIISGDIKKLKGDYPVT